MKPLRIIHCAYFNTIRLKGCYLTSMGYKINNGLTRLGHSVMTYCDRENAKIFAPLGFKTKGSLKKTNDNFYAFCLNVQPDAIILGHADIITADTLLKIREKLPAIKILQWNVDNINHESDEGTRNSQNIKSKLEAVDFTLITTADKKLLSQFEPSKHNVGFIPNPVDASIENGRVFEISKPEYDLFFAAAPQKHREFNGEMMKGAEISDFLMKNLPEHRLLFPKINHPALNGYDYLTALKQSATVLNVSMINHDYLYSSDRMAHAMGNGALAFVDRRTGFNDLFDENEIAFFNSAEELIEKAIYFKNNQSERMKTAERGWKKYHNLFNELVIGKYIASLLAEEFNEKDFLFPTTCNAKTKEYIR